MNLILLERDDFLGPQRVRLTGRRARHVIEVHRAKVGDRLRVGLLGGAMGEAVVAAVEQGTAEPAATKLATVELAVVELAEVTLGQKPPSPLDLVLVLALPRPKVLRRLVAAVTSFGLKELHLVHSARVEKSYWQSPRLRPEELQMAIRLGQEQGRDTLPMVIHQHRRFRLFAEDQLPQLLEGRAGYVAHPGAERVCPSGVGGPALLAVGPEGGFIDFEVQLLQSLGVAAVSLGERALSVETAVSALLGRLMS
ncbi:MAG: 16S rRNA (uracil(1498)-N(3))-methyltransferase [Acidobacteriota bacterium]